MKRMNKFKDLREQIEKENISAIFTNFNEYYYIFTHQKEVKEEKGCKH